MSRWMMSLLAVLIPVVTVARAEVSIEQSPSRDLHGLVLAGIIDDGGGWPEAWSVVRPGLDVSWYLNVSGAARGDMAPDMVINQGTGRAEVVWALWDGTDFEIAHSEWLGSEWSAPVLLTDNAADDLDPRLDPLEGGGLGVTWWRDESSPEVLYAERLTADSQFSAEMLVSDGADAARSPAITRMHDTTFVGYESAGVSITSVIVESRTSPGTFSPEVIASTSRPGGLDVRIDEARGRVWAVWIDSPSHLGWSERTESGWTSPMYELYEGDGDLERARLRIKAEVLR